MAYLQVLTNAPSLMRDFCHNRSSADVGRYTCDVLDEIAQKNGASATCSRPPQALHFFH